jgi:hypothetical protein
VKTAILRPTNGGTVRDPDTFEKLPVEGAEKELTSYWLRRIESGDVVLVEPENSGTKQKTSSEK